MGKSTTASRERARKVYATRMAEQRRIEALNEEDLAAYFAEAENVVDAERGRESARAAAERAYKKALADADDAFERASKRAAERQATALRKLRERGETIPVLAELTGASAGEIRKLVGKAPRVVPTDSGSESVGATPDSATDDHTTAPGEARESTVAVAS